MKPKVESDPETAEQILAPVVAALTALRNLKNAAYEAVYQAARDACRAVHVSAAGRCGFDAAVRPVSTAVLMELGMFLDSGPSFESVTPALALLHRNALAGGYDELAGAIRSIRGRRIVIGAARTHGPRLARDADEFALEQVAAFEREIAQQLVDAGLCLPWSRILAEDLPRLSAEIEAERDRLEADARAETERLEQEERAAQEAIQAVEDQGREEIAAYFDARPSLVFQVGSRSFSGVGCAMLARRQGAWDVEGLLSRDRNVAVPSIDDLRAAMRRQQAAEAVA